MTALIVALCAVTAAGCGDDGPRVDVEPPPSPSAPGVPVRGTERLAWDQPASSYQRLQQYSFRIYVDGGGAALPGVDCLDSTSGGAFPCSARLPAMPDGPHTLQLAAVADGIESERSGGLVVSVGQGRMVVDTGRGPESRAGAAGIGREAAGGARATEICLGDACFELRRQVTRALPVSAPALLPDGRLLFVEGDRHVRVAEAGIVRGEPALSLAEGAQIVALLVDEGFASNRTVRIAATVPSPRRGRTFSVTRVRELDGRLGEAAVIVSEIALPPTGTPRVAQDSEGRLYVAVPGREGQSSNDAGGAILRFSRDGLTWAAGLGSPVLAEGFTHPHAIAFDHMRSRLWVSGRDRVGTEQLRSLLLQPDVEGASQAVTVASPPLVGIGALRRAASDGARLLVADERGRLAWAQPEALARTEGAAVPGEHVVGVTGTARGGALLTTRSTGGAMPVFSVFTLDAMQP